MFFLENTDQTLFNIWVPRLVARMKQMAEFEGVQSDMTQQGRELQITIDRATAARFGITAATIDNALYDAFGQRIASTLYTQSNQYRVILNADLKDLRSLDDALSGIYLPSSTASSGQVPLTAIVRLSTQSGPLQIEHLGQLPSISVSFNLAQGASLGQAVTDIEKAEKDIGLPDTFFTSYQGALTAFQKSLSNEVLLIAAAVVAVYIVLGVLYESFIHPVTILSTLPSAGVGALLALRIAGSDLDIIGIIGIILLIGIVKKNAIMMIDFALERERVEGKTPLRIDPRGMPVAVPADPDDYNGGDARGNAAHAGQRHRLGIAAAIGHRDRRRPGGEPVADVVYYAGDLSGVRPAGDAGERLVWVRAAARSGAGGMKSQGKARGSAPGPRWGRCPRPPLALRGFSPFPQQFFIVGVWGPRPQRVQGRALAFLPSSP